MQSIKSNVVIAAAAGYDNGKIHNFLYSLADIKFQGKVILLVENGREPFEPFDLDLSAVHIDLNLNKEDRKSPSFRRYFWIRDFLERFRCDERIMLTDVRDVVFQSDPFESDYVGRTPLLFALEERSIGSCQYNTNWSARMYGAGVLDAIDGYIISCSGTTIGTHGHIYAYVRKMCRHLQIAPDVFGIDQGIHNYILYKDAIEGQRLGLNGLSYVATIQYMHRLDIVDGIAVNYDRKKIPVLHQYDRLNLESQRQIAAIHVPVG